MYGQLNSPMMTRHHDEARFDQPAEAALLVGAARRRQPQCEAAGSAATGPRRSCREMNVSTLPRKNPADACRGPRRSRARGPWPRARSRARSGRRRAIRTNRSRPVESTPRRSGDGLAPVHDRDFTRLGVTVSPAFSGTATTPVRLGARSVEGVEVHVVGAVTARTREHRGRDRQHHDEEDDDDAGDGPAVLPELPPEDLPRRAADDLLRLWGGRRISTTCSTSTPSASR